MDETYDLIFLDSFSHDNSEDLNLDLVQFSNSVIIQEVRIIPNKLKVLVDFPGKVTYGCTTPSSFKVEFYVNNLSKPNASTFEKIGILDYHENGEYVIKSDQKKLTDGLIIKGWYQNITLAIYGTLTSLNQSTTSPPPTSAFKAKQQVVCQAVQSSSPKDIPLEHKGSVKDPRDNHDRLEGVFKMPEKKDKVSRKTSASAENNARGKKRELVGDVMGGVQHKKCRSSSPNIYFDDEEDVTEPGEIADGCDVVDENMDIYGALSDGEIPENDGEYSQISSDENNLQYVSCLPQEVELGDWEGVDDGTWTYGSISSFNPYQCELASLETFADPSLTEFEKEKLKLLSGEVVLDEIEDEQMPASSLFILNFIKHLKQGAQHEFSFVDSLESLPAHILPGLVFISQAKKLKENVEYLIDWACDNLENGLKAISFKNFSIKYLKAIIKLLGCLCTCDSHIAGIMMERNVQQKLLNAYDDMSPSISLQSLILASIDQSIRFKVGLDAFIRKQSTHSDGKTEACSQTPYQSMVGILLKKQKVHIYEVLSKLYKNVLNLQNKSAIDEFSNTTTNNNNNADVVSEDIDKMDEVVSDGLSSDMKQAEKNVAATSSSSEKKDSSNDNTIDDEMRLMKTNDDEISEEVMMIVACLDEVHTALQSHHQLAQPERFVIYKRQNALNSLSALIHIFDTCNLIECIFVLLSSPLTNNNPSIFMSLKNVLTSLTTSHQGLLFLTFKSEATNGILRILLQTSDYCQDDERELNAANQLGLFMAYHLQTIQYIDQLNEYHIKASLCEDQNVNDTAILAVMLNLYSMTFTFQGKEALVHVFTSNDNINTLISFIQADSGDNEKKHSPVCISYVLSIVLIIVQHTDEVGWLITNCKTLLAVVEQELKSGKADEQVKELYDWISPLKIIGTQTAARENCQTLALELLTALRQHADDMQDVPKSAVTILRVLKHLSIQSNDCQEVDMFREIQYKVVLNNLFGANCLSLFGSILLKVKNLLLLPWQLGFSMTPTRKWLVLSVVQPILLMMRAILTQLISLRDTKFADLSALAGLFGIHTVMCSTSQTGVLPLELQKIQNLIVDILMAYTQPTIIDSVNEDESLKFFIVGSDGLWSKMIGEVLKYTLSLPCTFLSGLILISELLPLPLPLQVKQEITSKQVDEVLLMRKRWAVQLLSHASVLHQIIRVLSATTIQPLNQLLRRVCWQIADLSAATAAIVVSSLIDILKESMDPSMDQAASTKAASDKATTTNIKCEQPECQASPRTYRILSLISFLVSQPAIKCSFLSYLKSNDAGEMYGDVIGRLISLLDVVSDQFAHLQAQEAILTIFQSLCDYEISLIIDSDLKLSNCLPSREHISLICLALLKHIGNRDHKFSTILLSLRTLSLLLEHDYGFYLVKR
ncbi:hypothetical protein HELRODRAFT_161283 [Helobdella robusta]|uniref:Virilizer N-terminal domain-containing protein n=1 Tax=Helobdella robusta TaxID=6412 RepID=T1ERA4_HELRO|nr:hypothetical protein HELRODRAFT_161283 [Helobdella robusta]ESO02055.1 hypothetical protein HELRODRAFT_161283 [Helobdella robusta]